MLMRLDINKAFFWLIKTPPGKKQKHQNKKKKKKNLGIILANLCPF